MTRPLLVCAGRHVRPLARLLTSCVRVRALLPAAAPRRCREAGIEEFIVKPFRVEDLKRVMQTCAPRHAKQSCGNAATTAAGAAAAAAGVQAPRV